MCPLLWCRESFDNLASTLQHVSECPWLSNAWYWCPYCCRPESFKVFEEPCVDTTQHKLQRKDSKLRRAVTFFKHLGLKSCSRHKNSGSSSAPVTGSLDTWLATQKHIEMEDTSHETSSPMELADTNRTTHFRRPNYEKQSKTLYEMEAGTLYASWGLKDLPRYSEVAGTATEPCELDVGTMFMATASHGTTGNTNGSLTGIGALFEDAWHDAEPSEEMLVSPVSTTQGPPICQSTGADKSRPTECGLVSPVHNDSGTVSSPERVDPDWRQIKVTRALTASLLSSEDNGSLCDGVMLSTQSQVEELREMVCVFNEEWIRRCQSIPDLALRASVLSPGTLFEKGAQTLQQVFRGVLPGTFDAIFGLAHIACASAYIMHGDDTSHCWNEFFQDILNWQHLMLKESDARSFIHLLNLLWWPQGSSAKMSCGNYFLDEMSGTLVPLRRPAVSFDASSSTETHDSEAQPLSTTPVSMSLLNSLKNGAVLQECLRFLDGIEYAGIMKRSKKYPTHLPWYAQNHVTNIEEMLKTVIHPLQCCDGIEGLRGSIDLTVTELRDGSLRSVREVEVSLILNGKSSCLSPQVYKRYLDAVASICDRAMHEAGPNWRDRCYATHLDTVLASIVEMDTQRLKQIRPCHQSKINVEPMPGAKHTLAESIPTPSSTQSQTLVGSSPITSASPTFTSGSSPTIQSSSMTSPESAFSAQSPSSSTDVTHCPLCSALFTGSLRDRSSNLRRHMRTTRNHGSVVGLLCTVPGCNAVISRSDNLVKHIRTVHEGDTGTLRQQVARKRRRDGNAAE